MTKNVDFLLIGGGLTSATCAETLRKEGAEGEILIISAENFLPYHRPPLTKRFLLGKQKKESLLVLKESYYEENEIDVVLGAKAIAVDTEAKIVKTDSAGEFHFKKLLLATGSRLQKLSVPGSNLPGIYYLRTVSCAETIMKAMETARKAVVVGASFIGMELASSFAMKGIQTTIVEKEEAVFCRLESPEISKFFTDYYKSQGVEVILGEAIKKFLGKDRVESVITSRGKTIPCDFVAVGIGVTPDLEFLRGSGIELGNGIIVDEYMQTSNADIYAAGDVANFFDPVFGRQRRIEHWDNAVKQGEVAARNMMGRKEPYRAVSYFFSDVFDLSFNFIGDTDGVAERIVRGSVKEKSFSVLYLKDDVIRAAFLLGMPLDEDKAAGSLILNRVNLKTVKDKLPDTNFPLHKIPAQTVLILQGGGALGAFECGVVEAMEENGIYPDIVAGISIGAFNSAIIAGNPENAAPALREFWNEISLNTPAAQNEEARRLFSSWYVLFFGSPKFFRPRWLMPVFNLGELPMNWTSFYDASPVKKLLLKYVDFKKLKKSPVRLLVSAVNVETAELETFDSYVEDITPDHILASGSLPPGFPWTTINGKHYWDGGIISNTPLDQVIELGGLTGKKIYIVNLFPGKSSLPKNMMEVEARKDEIFFSERIRKELHVKEVIEGYRQLVEEIMSYVEPGLSEQIRQRPRYIETMGDSGPISITRIIHDEEESEPPSKGYDFSRRTIERNIEKGYRAAKKTLEKEEQKKRLRKGK